MKSVDIIDKDYRRGREYNPKSGGPYPIEDWILIEESDGWVKGAERYISDDKKYRIRFIYWKFENNKWDIGRLHPVMNIEVVKKLIAEMLLKNWI